MRKPVIVANWKMNNTVPEALKFVAALTLDIKAAGNVDVVIAAPFTALYSLGVALTETDFKLAAQNLHWEDSGAFTGEISGAFLKDVGASFVITGHSERRQLFGETDETVNKRNKAALRYGLVPIFCIGETLPQREENRTWKVIEGQLEDGLKGIVAEFIANIVIAYEPVWAIGTGRNATPDQAQEVHGLIRKHINTHYGSTVAEGIRIIYGGSVKPSNSRDIMCKDDVDGALVGGASLDAKQFAAIVRSAH